MLPSSVSNAAVSFPARSPKTGLFSSCCPLGQGLLTGTAHPRFHRRELRMYEMSYEMSFSWEQAEGINRDTSHPLVNEILQLVPIYCCLVARPIFVPLDGPANANTV